MNRGATNVDLDVKGEAPVKRTIEKRTVTSAQTGNLTQTVRNENKRKDVSDLVNHTNRAWTVNTGNQKDIPGRVLIPANSVSKALGDGKNATDIVEKEDDDNKENSIRLFKETQKTSRKKIKEIEVRRL